MDDVAAKKKKRRYYVPRMPDAVERVYGQAWLPVVRETLRSHDDGGHSEPDGGWDYSKLTRVPYLLPRERRSVTSQ